MDFDWKCYPKQILNMFICKYDVPKFDWTNVRMYLIWLLKDIFKKSQMGGNLVPTILVNNKDEISRYISLK